VTVKLLLRMGTLMLVVGVVAEKDLPGMENPTGL
jgi:hypothetical protein